MTWLIWVFLGIVFMKCIGWVLAPFRSRRDDDYEEYEYEENTNVTINVTITDSFNYHSSNSDYKGGNQYYVEEKSRTTTDKKEAWDTADYYDAYSEAIQRRNDKRS